MRNNNKSFTRNNHYKYTINWSIAIGSHINDNAFSPKPFESIQSSTIYFKEDLFAFNLTAHKNINIHKNNNKNFMYGHWEAVFM